MTRVGLRSTSLLHCLLIVYSLGIAVGVVTGTAHAGQSRVELSGVVRDTSSAVVADARVEALVAGRSVAAVTTDQDGRYRLDLPASNVTRGCVDRLFLMAAVAT